MSFNETSLKTGIVGLGYVGGSIYNVLNMLNKQPRSTQKYFTYDVDTSKNPSCEDLLELGEKSDIIYIAVPTPMKSTGECDISIVESVIQTLSQIQTSKILVIKSTVPPGTTEMLQTKYPQHSILFSPEFLTEANYLTDITTPPVLLLGKPSTVSDWVATVAMGHQLQFVDSAWLYHLKTKILSATSAELYKYIANTFLATKVSFANEMATLAEKLNVDWDELSDMIKIDHRLGKTHWKVPGPDGRTGYSGHCFPKDLSALLEVAKIINVPTPILQATWDRNVTIDRPERDWEELKGRAVSE